VANALLMVSLPTTNCTGRKKAKTNSLQRSNNKKANETARLKKPGASTSKDDLKDNHHGMEGLFLFP
jgi:hypothetical protein